MVLNQDYESDEDMQNEWEMVSEDERQKEQQSLLDDEANRILALRSYIAEEVENTTVNATSEERSKAIDDSSDRDNDEKISSSIAEIINNDQEKTAASITTPLIAEESATPTTLEDNGNETTADSNAKDIQCEKKSITPSDDDVEKEKIEETTPLKVKKDNTPSPKPFPFFWGVASRLADTVKDIDKKHQFREKAQKSFKTAETSAQHVCHTIGGAVMDIDKKHEVRKRTGNSFVGKSAQDIGKKIGGAVMDIDKKHEVLRRTENSFKAVGTSARDVGKKISTEVKGSTRAFSQGIGTKTSEAKEHIQRVYDKTNVEEKVRNTAEKIKTTTKKAGQKARHFNEEYHVAEVIGTVAVVGAGLFLAKGNIRAGATAAAAGGAIYMAGESMKAPYRHDSGLNERMHME